MPRSPKAPTLADVTRELLTNAGRTVTLNAAHLGETPLAWEGTRNDIDRLRGIEVAHLVLHNQELLNDNSETAMRAAYDHLRSARVTLAAIGEGRKADAVETVMRAVLHVIETYYARPLVGASR
jgi:hypothetical protein